ncbi:class I SAM-dependent methyltransferase [Kitasatospora sp. NPDC058115]|uniref:class I SAM-dependent methyltransferase n=1 Tax=Kitasatospora sp. NPDC058115 TaxID=3346347 RepID=UPI0036D92DAB
MSDPGRDDEPTGPTGPSVAPLRSLTRFYDRLAPGYHLVYADWEASVAEQGASLDALLRARLGDAPADVLDCACGIGTQALGLAARGHRVTGTDLSPVSAARAAREAAARGLRLPTAAADMRRLPCPDGRFDAVVCADNALPHLLTATDVRAALAELRRVLRPGGLLMLSTRPYDDLRRDRPTATEPRVSVDGDGRRVVSFQLWHWHEDGERYDLELFRLTGPPDGNDQDWGPVSVHRATYWALTRDRLARFATEAGFTAVEWQPPAATGFFQPVLLARAGRPVGTG